MSSLGSPTLDLDVRFRRTERLIACVAIAAAMISPWLIQSFMPLSLVLLSMSAASLVAAGFWRLGWIGQRHRLHRIVWLADGRWVLSTGGGERLEAELSHKTRRGRAFAWLRWQAPHRYSMLLVRGDLAGSELRRLLVRLGIDRLSRPLPPHVPVSRETRGPSPASLAATLKTRLGSPGSFPGWGLPVARTRRR
jgi:hypothetical protein